MCCACISGNINLVKMLIEMDYTCGQRCLLEAGYTGNLELLDLLIDNGAYISVDGYALYRFVCFYGILDSVRYFCNMELLKKPILTVLYMLSIMHT